VSGFLIPAFAPTALSTRLKKNMRKDSLLKTNSFLRNSTAIKAQRRDMNIKLYQKERNQ
jgi:hypothetical protein